jgi:diguanylate cyclase (GGDEF)-like protein
LLPATSSKDALEIAERLRTEVEKESFLSENKRPITISIGIGNSTLCDDMDKLYKAADAALYKAKRTRNAVAWNDFGVAAEAA